MLLKRLLTNLNRINHRFCFFNINFLSRESKIITFSKSTFCSGEFKNRKFKTASAYYQHYIMSKPESYPLFSDTLALKREVESDTESFKLLSESLNKLEENSSLDEIKKIIAVEFNCDVNEICKKLFFIRKNATLFNKKTEELINELDKELWKKPLTRDELIKILITYYMTYFRNESSFAKNKIVKFFTRIKNLSPHQVVQVFFLMPKKNFSDFKGKYQILSYVNDNISLFNTDEVGIITRGFLRGTFTFSHSDLYSSIIRKIIEDIETIHSISLQYLCKAVFKLSLKSNSKLILDVQERSIPYVSKFSTLALIDLSELGARTQCKNISFWETVIKRYKENISNLPLTCILRILKQVIIYKTKDDELLKQIIEEFEKCKNDEEKHEYFVFLLCNLTYCNLYPKNLLDIVFSENFISQKILSSKFNKLKVFWWILYSNLEIEKPEYLNYELNDNMRKKLHRWCQIVLWDQEKVFYKKIKNSFKKIEIDLKNLYGENTVVRTDCLPQHDSGLVLRFNKYLEAQPIPENFHLSSKGYVRKPIDDNNYWVFLNLIAFDQYGVNGLTILEHHPTQYRQLKAVGYIPIMIPVQQYLHHERENTQHTFITELIQNSIKKKEEFLKN